MRRDAWATGLVSGSAPGASATGNDDRRVRATIEAKLSAGPNPFTVVRPRVITGPDRDEERIGERVGALAVDVLGTLLHLVGSRRRAARWAAITGPALAEILVSLAAQPLDRRAQELDHFRR